MRVYQPDSNVFLFSPTEDKETSRLQTVVVFAQWIVTTEKVQVKVYRLAHTLSNRTESKLIFRLVMRTCNSASERDRIEQGSKWCDVVSHVHCIRKDGCSVSIIWRISVRGLCSKLKKNSLQVTEKYEEWRRIVCINLLPSGGHLNSSYC